MPAINQHINIIDLTVQQYGTVEALFDVALHNGYGITEQLPAGTNVSFELKNVIVKTVSIPEPAAKPMATVLKTHQHIIDYATQHCGTVEALFELALLNGISVTADINPGTELQHDEVNKKVIDYFLVQALDIATNYVSTNGYEPPTGIGYMQIGNDFKVS